MIAALKPNVTYEISPSASPPPRGAVYGNTHRPASDPNNRAKLGIGFGWGDFTNTFELARHDGA